MSESSLAMSFRRSPQLLRQRRFHHVSMSESSLAKELLGGRIISVVLKRKDDCWVLHDDGKKGRSRSPIVRPRDQGTNASGRPVSPTHDTLVTFNEPAASMRDEMIVLPSATYFIETDALSTQEAASLLHQHPSCPSHKNDNQIFQLRDRNHFSNIRGHVHPPHLLSLHLRCC